MIHVTEVLDSLTEQELLRWMLTTPKAKREQISQEAMNVGHVVEDIIYADIRGTGILPTAPPTPIPVLNCLQAWQRFKEQHPTFCADVTGIQTEYTLGEIVGHSDLEVTDARGWGIVDIKCSGAIYPKYWVQVCQYAWMKNMGLNGFGNPAFVGILRLDKKTGQFDYQEITDWQTMRYEQLVFEAYYTVYRHGEKVRERLRLALEKEVLDVA